MGPLNPKLKPDLIITSTNCLGPDPSDLPKEVLGIFRSVSSITEEIMQISSNEKWSGSVSTISSRPPISQPLPRFSLKSKNVSCNAQAGGIDTGMKGWSFNGVRRKQLSLTLIAFICTTILVCAWEKTPIISTLIPPQNRFDIFTPGILVGTLPTHLVCQKQKEILEPEYRNASRENDIPDSSFVGGTQVQEPGEHFDVAMVDSTATSKPKIRNRMLNSSAFSMEKKGGEERLDVEDVGWEYGLVRARGALILPASITGLSSGGLDCLGRGFVFCA